jgi:energy-coupling factor transporter transmembrane protein EcfT
MGTSLLQNLRELWRALGYSMVSLQLAIWGAFFLVELLLLAAVPLSVTALGGMFYGIVAIYTPLALGIVFSPFIWGTIGTTATLVAQPGGEEGLSAKDALDKMSDWGKKSLENMLVYLVFFPPVFLVYLALGGAKGWVNEHLLFVLLLPTLLVFIRIEFPGGRLAFKVIGWGLMLLVIVLLVNGAVNITNHQVTAPAVALMQEYQQQLGQDVSKEEADLIQELIDKVKERGLQSLTPTEKKFWNEHWAAAQKTGSLKKRVETLVIEAEPSDPNWWKDHWHYALGAAAVVIALYWFFGRTTRRAAGEASAEGAHAPAKHTLSRLRGFIYLAIILWCGYSLYTGTGWPGTWYKNSKYVKEVDLTLTTLEDQELCFPAVRPGKWYVALPEQAKMAHPYVNVGGKYNKALGFYVRYPDGTAQQLSWLQNVRINGTRVGFDEQVEFDTKGCVKVSTAGPIRSKSGEPRTIACPTGRPDLCYGSPYPTPPTVVMRVSGTPWVVPNQN